MDEVTFAREVIALHPRALVVWATDVGPIPTGDNVKVVNYSIGSGVHGGMPYTMGHVQDLPIDGTPGRVYKLDIDSMGLLHWTDNAKPIKQEVASASTNMNASTNASTRNGKASKGITFKTTVEILQLPRMIGYREKQIEQAEARQRAVAEIATQKEARIATRLAALAERLSVLHDPRAVHCHPASRTHAEDLLIRAKRIERKHETAEARLVQRAKGEQRRREINAAMRRYNLPPVGRWRT